MLIPINMRGLPSNIQELKLGNYVTAIKFELPLHKNIQSAIKSAKNAIRDYLNPILLRVLNNFSKFWEWMPIVLSKKAFFDFYHNVHLIFSNIPFSEVSWYLWNKEITEFGAYVNCQLECNLNIVCITYKKMMRLYVMANSELKMNPQELIDIIIDEITEEIKEHCKSE